MKRLLFLILCTSSFFSGNSQVKITGVVHDDKKPLPNVYIYEKGTSNTIKSDKDGKFIIEVSKLIEDKYLIEFSSEGYYITQISGTKDETRLVVEMTRKDEN